MTSSKIEPTDINWGYSILIQLQKQFPLTKQRNSALTLELVLEIYFLVTKALQTDMLLRGINVYLFFKIMCSVTLLIAD